MSAEKNIGIDFGTTNTVIYCRDSKGKIKKIGGKSIKSAVYFIGRNEYIIGQAALERANLSKNGKALAVDFKPNITNVFEISAEDGSSFRLKGEAVARLFLSKVMLEYIEPRLNKMFENSELNEHDKTVITVPAKFDVEQKAKIKRAAKGAYFPNVSLAFEPTAAAVAALDSDVNDDVIAVYDFGGGTFDISVIEKNGQNRYIQIDEDGNNTLGGNAVTNAIAENLILPMLEEQGTEFSMDIDDMEFDEDDSAMTEEEYLINKFNILKRIEEIKEDFSDIGYDKYSSRLFLEMNGESREFMLEISRAEFNSAIEALIRNTVEITRNVVERARKKKKYIKKIVLAGGSSQLTLVEEMMKAEFEDAYDIEVVMSDSVFDLIAKGAMLMSEQHKLIRVEEKTSTQFGIGTRTGMGINKFDMLIDCDMKLPVSACKHFVTDSNILRTGEVSIPCYEKDVKNYPNAVTEGDKGIRKINTYKLKFKKSCNPSAIEVTFNIESDGTLCIEGKLFDAGGRKVAAINTEIMSESELE